MTTRRRRSRRTQQTFRRRRLTAVLVAAVALAAAVVAITAGGSRNGHGAPAGRQHPAGPAAPGSSSSATAPATQHGTTGRPAASAYRVGMTSLTLDEPATPATATGHAATGAPIRALPVTVRYPAQGTADAGAHPGADPAAGSGPFPLAVFSQGYDIAAEDYAWLLDAWSRAGYVVAAPTYPLTDPASPTGVNERDIVNHPADLRFVISSLRAATGNPRSILHGLIDPSRVGLVGHSDGGDVSLAVADNSCCRDLAVKAVVSLSGAELAAFGGRYYGAGHVPLLVVQGSADTINVPGCSAQIYDGAPRPRYYLDVEGAEHEPPYLEAGPERVGVARAVLAFLNAYLGHRPARLEALVHGRAVTGGETLTTGPLPAGTSTACPGAP